MARLNELARNELARNEAEMGWWEWLTCGDNGWVVYSMPFCPSWTKHGKEAADRDVSHILIIGDLNHPGIN